MHHLRRAAPLLQEALHDLRPLEVIGAKELDREIAAELDVARGVDDAVAAVADPLPDLVLADALAVRERDHARILSCDKHGA